MGTLRRNSQDQSEASLTSEAAEVLAAPDARECSAGDSAFVAAVKRQFLPGGTLSRATDGFVSRPGQVAFAESVARAIETHDTLVVEAGTGTGKTFAYLTPALMSDCRVIVSTAGKSLQDQLFGKDIPAVKRVLLNNADVALLKGRANYLCKYRMDHAEFLPSPAAVQDLAAVKRFAKTTKTGDRNEIRGVAENSVIWPYVTSTNENCLGRRCPNAEECFVTRARNRARAAKVVVVNHHLFLSAVAAAAASADTREAIEPLQPELVTGEELPALSDDAGDLIGHVDSDEGLLPHADVVIFDEAHKIPEIALSFFGEELATFAIKSVVEEMRGVLLSKFASYAPKESTWVQVCDVVTHALQDMMLALDIAGLAPETNVNLKDFTADALKDAGYGLAFLSNCGEAYRDRHRRAFGLDRWIDAYYRAGAYPGLEKWEIYERVAPRHAQPHLMVGDRFHDIDVAVRAGIPSIGCAFGFGAPDELDRATVTVARVADVPAAVERLIGGPGGAGA